ncbi:MAG: hypothetical protein J6L69_00880 [Lachnospiraceae bacterium]|nr:hypothetical protein [Lachnospiraceae bacterium]
MNELNSKVYRIVKNELGSVKVMIMAIMISFGLVLSIANFVISVFNSADVANKVKELIQSPYDAQTNNALSLTILVVMVIEVLLFLVNFIPLVLMAFGIYLIYENAKKTDGMVKTTGLKIVGGVMKYHGIVYFVYVGLFAIVAIALVVLTHGFTDKVASFLGSDDIEFIGSIKVLSVFLLFIVGIVAFVLIGIGVIFLSLSKTMKFVAGTQYGKLEGKISGFGVAIMLLVGAHNLTSIFSGFSASAMSQEDIQMMEEMFGGTVANIIVNMMPSDTIQFEMLVISTAYAFFIGATQLLGAITLVNMRSKINRAIQEQEFNNYGGDNFIGGNQC